MESSGAQQPKETLAPSSSDVFPKAANDPPSQTAQTSEKVEDLQELREKDDSTAVGHDKTPSVSDKVTAVQGDNWEHDPGNPRNWSFARKWTCVSVVSLYSFIPPLASSMMASGLPEVGDKYGITNSTTLASTLTVFLISFALGPLFQAPLSEMYGRTWVLHINNILTLAFNLGCAFSPNTASLIVFRFLTGLSGSAPIAIGSGSIGDMFSERDRASAMAVSSLGPLLGPALGPVAGGFVAQTVGIKYVFIVIAGCCGVISAIGITFLRETYAPVLRLRRAKRLGTDPEMFARLGLTESSTGSKKQLLWLNLSRPVVLLFRSFICFILSLYQAFLYGTYYLMFATFPSFFSDTYGFGPGIGGLMYLGLGIGFLLATILGAKAGNSVYIYLVEKNGGQGKPEMRMPALFFGSFFVPIGLFWYGWSAQAKLHWIMPVIGTGIFSFGMMTVYLPIYLYLVDSFKYAASATSAAAVFRSLLGFAFPLFGSQMFDKLGLGGGNSLLGGLAIVLGIPFPVWIYYKGEAIRARSDLTR